MCISRVGLTDVDYHGVECLTSRFAAGNASKLRSGLRFGLYAMDARIITVITSSQLNLNLLSHVMKRLHGYVLIPLVQADVYQVTLRQCFKQIQQSHELDTACRWQ